MIITRWQAPVTPGKEQIDMMFTAEGLEPLEETISKGEEIPMDRHPFDEVRMVLEGELLLNIAGNKLLLRTGDRILIPSNTKHSKTTGPHCEKCICIFANKIY